MLRSAVSALALAFVLGACAPDTPKQAPLAELTTEEQAALSESLNAWFDAKYEEQLQESPFQLTFLGRKEKNDQLDCVTVACQDEQLAKAKAAVDELKATFNYDQLSPADKDSYDLWVFQYEQAAKAVQYRDNGLVFNQMSGTHTFVPTFLMQFHTVDEEADAAAYVKRISAAGGLLRELLSQAKDKAGKGVHAPKFAYDAVAEESRKIITGAPFTDGPDSVILADFKADVQQLVDGGKTAPETAAQLVADAEAALKNDFQPVYEEIIAFVTEDSANSPDVSGPQGLSTQPNGGAYYDFMLSQMTTTDMTADEIHNLGLSEVDRIHGEMEAIKAQVGFEGTLNEFFASIRDDKGNPQHYYPDTDEGRQAYIDDATAAIQKIKAVLPEYFGLLPKADLVVKRVEAFREQPGAAQHYYPGTPDGSRPGVYYAHLSDMKAMPKGELEVIAYHEGLPGHHMQISIAQELTGVPQFRTQAGFTAYSEGWGLYSEKLAKEMPGTYTDPYSDFGRLGSEIWRAIRLVVDTGLHSKGWTEDQAVQYFLDNSAITEAQARSEVQRYIVIPGQATAYKVGMIEIQQMRARAEAELGDKFDIRAFHDTVLGGGALPLAMLNAKIDRWIAGVKAS
ncbi:DUF885 domain-containing protein [Hyphomonas sp. WL0036]|uniref:DUF885 domain-containing protein n=1 Tax=Hyphomonas sediminis TaxID=2866160 RepID=UPI001C7E71C0|nr:DUF885 domain-containing protein [Hyphomonas sediminis]MBY9066338.1 DUF885 domain-containing protein [Hyphomonas sediminis]